MENCSTNFCIFNGSTSDDKTRTKNIGKSIGNVVVNPIYRQTRLFSAIIIQQYYQNNIKYVKFHLAVSHSQDFCVCVRVATADQRFQLTLFYPFLPPSLIFSFSLLFFRTCGFIFSPSFLSVNSLL